MDRNLPRLPRSQEKFDPLLLSTEGSHHKQERGIRFQKHRYSNDLMEEEFRVTGRRFDRNA